MRHIKNQFIMDETVKKSLDELCNVEPCISCLIKQNCNALCKQGDIVLKAIYNDLVKNPKNIHKKF